MFLMEGHHLSKAGAATVVSASFLGLGVGGPALGALSDRLKCRKPVMVWGNILGLAALSIVIYCTNLPAWALVILLFLFGFGVAGFMLAFALGKEINALAVAGTVIALINSGDAIFGAITEPLIGHLLDLGWSGRLRDGVPYFRVENFHHALLVLPIYIIVATILLFWVKEHQPS